jgi:hypothetical protein
VSGSVYGAELVIPGLFMTGHAVIFHRGMQDFQISKVNMAFGCDTFLGRQPGDQQHQAQNSQKHAFSHVCTSPSQVYFLK